MQNLDEIKQLIENSNNIVFFGGAGVSTASGLPDFRSATGLYNKKNNANYSPEYMLSHDFFENHPEEFNKYVKENLMIDGVLPNDCHYALTKLEKMGKLQGIITQNIDDLHQRAGSKNVIELHGSLKDYYCVSCGQRYDYSYVSQFDKTPKCEKCGSIIRPDIVLYGEGLDQNNISHAINLISHADVLIVGGTSLVVYPAAGLIEFYKGDKLVLINKDDTGKEAYADYVIKGDISKIMKEVVEDI